MLTGEHGDVAALAAIAATGTTTGDEFLTPERHTAVTAVARFNVDFYFVDEQEGTGQAEACPRYSVARMLINFPSRPRLRNSTIPGILAKMVSSLPTPAFSPA